MNSQASQIFNVSALRQAPLETSSPNTINLQATVLRSPSLQKFRLTVCGRRANMFFAWPSNRLGYAYNTAPLVNSIDPDVRVRIK